MATDDQALGALMLVIGERVELPPFVSKGGPVSRLAAAHARLRPDKAPRRLPTHQGEPGEPARTVAATFVATAAPGALPLRAARRQAEIERAKSNNRRRAERCDPTDELRW